MQPDNAWREISESLDVALGLDPDARAAWLDDLQSTRAALAAELRRLLERRESMEAAGFLVGAGLPGELLGSAPRALVGARLGPWTIEEEIGRGGMGSVWRAGRNDGRYQGFAAIKFLNLGALGRDGEQRFRREGLLLGRLNHPNIARLLDAGVHGDAHQPYLVLEYVDGLPIDSWCEARQLGARGRVALFLDVLLAVAHAHSHLIIHRDLKPSNILATAAGEIKLLDFGIARLATGDEAAPQTHSSTVGMTPQYAAPEQILGEAITTRTDVYALGLVLFRLLTGRHAIDAEGVSGPALMRRALECETPAMSASVVSRSIDSSDLQGDLDNIVAKALRKPSQERYASVGALADDLERWLRDEPVTARPDTVTYRVGKFVRRHRGGVAVTALSALALISATGITTQQMLEARRQRNEAVLQSRRADAQSEFMNGLFSSPPPRTGAPLDSSWQLALGVELIESQYADFDPAFAGRMLVQLAGEFRGQMNTGKAIEIFNRAFELGRVSGDPQLHVLARCGATYALARGGQHEAAAKALVEARQLLASIEASPFELRVACLQAGAALAGRTQHSDVALRELEQARLLIEQGGTTHRSSYTRVLTDIGGLHLENGRMREALQMSELVEATHVRNGRGGTGTRVMAMQNRAVTLSNMGEFLEAARVREEVSKRLLVLDPSQGRAYAFVVNLAVIENRLGSSRQALDRLQGIPEQARLEGNRSWELAARAAQIEALVDLGRLEEARILVDASSVLPGKADPAPSATRALIDQQDARIGIRSGNLAAARAAQQRLLTAATRSEASEHSARSSVWVTLSEVALADGRVQEARRYAIRGLERAERDARGVETSAIVGEALVRLARAERELGDVASALTHLQRAVHCFENGYGPAHRATRGARALVEEIRAT